MNDKTGPLEYLAAFLVCVGLGYGLAKVTTPKPIVLKPNT